MDASTPAPAHSPVLIVDDDDDVRETLRFVLEDAGYRVADAATIADALHYLHAATLDQVVLLDYLAPSENADVLLRTVVTEVPLQRHCYVLMPANPPTRFSGEAQCLIARWCRDVVLKPFELTTLLAAIEHAEARLAQRP